MDPVSIERTGIRTGNIRMHSYRVTSYNRYFEITFIKTLVFVISVIIILLKNNTVVLNLSISEL